MTGLVTGDPRLILVEAGLSRFVAGLGAGAVTVRVGRFPNGELVVEVPEEVDGRACVIVGSVTPPAGNVERLTLLAHTAHRAGARHVRAVVPYLAYARQDRAAAGQSLGLAWLGELLAAGHVEDVVCVDVHSPEASDVLGLPVISLDPARLLAQALPQERRAGVTFVAPDEGAVERCTAVARAAGAAQPVVWLRKRRTARGVHHLGLVGEPGRRAVIVDDILDTGGTLVSACRALREAGTREIAVLVTHGLFTGRAWRKLMDLGVLGIWQTDTVLARHRPFDTQVVPVAPLLRGAFCTELAVSR